jgi:hypothetical protein
MATTTNSQIVVAGLGAGVAESVCVQPFDLLKTRFQLNPGQNPSIAAAMRDIYKEGCIASDTAFILLFPLLTPFFAFTITVNNVT